MDISNTSFKEKQEQIDFRGQKLIHFEMRKCTLFLCFITIVFSFSYGQSQEKKKSVSLELNQFITNSGFASCTGLSIKVNSANKRSLAVGTFFSPELKRICGISFHHEIMLWREKQIMNNVIKPFIFYNFIYRKTTIPEILTDKRIKGDLVTYTSMEHYIGIGAKINMFKSLYGKCDLGFGTYLGSIKKPSAPDPIKGKILGTNGFGLLAEVGIGYRLFKVSSPNHKQPN